MSLEDQIKTQGFRNERQKALIYLMFTAYQVKSRISNVLKEFGLTPEQFNVLRILRGSHPRAMCVRDIASRMIERNSNVPRIADRLELKRLVDRCPSEADRRETLLSLTPAGSALLTESSNRMQQAEDELFSLTEEQAAELNKLFDTILPD